MQGARGQDGVRKLFFEQVGQGKLGLSDGRIYPHILFQPVITLAPYGRSAKGRWRILAMLGGYGGTATWYSGVYENEYVRDGGVWKIAALALGTEGHGGVHCSWLEGFGNASAISFYGRERDDADPGSGSRSAKAANGGASCKRWPSASASLHRAPRG